MLKWQLLTQLKEQINANLSNRERRRNHFIPTSDMQVLDI
jgi:hypothetical protein